MTLPTLYLSHGAPTLALEPGKIGPLFSAIAGQLPRPEAVLVISAHWLTHGVEVTTHPAPVTIHDFGGFPEVLYRLCYPAPGAPMVARRVIDLLAEAGVPARENPERGLDHGAWVPLSYLYPKADVPVFQFSLPATASNEVLWMLGNALQALREEGVLIIASGGVTHNLHEFRFGTRSEEPYARAFMEWVDDEIMTADREGLLDYRRRAPNAARAHPTDEHWRPVYVALGAAGEDWSTAVRFDGGIDFGVIGMDAYAFGVPPELAVGLAALSNNKH